MIIVLIAEMLSVELKVKHSWKRGSASGTMVVTPDTKCLAYAFCLMLFMSLLLFRITVFSVTPK